MAKKKTPRDMNIFFILDGSGSMAPVQTDVVNGVNNFIDEQRKEKAKTKFWLTVFDTNVYKVNEADDIKDVASVTSKETLKGGLTALLDAVGKTLIDAKQLDNTKKCENLVIVYTDGAENASKEFDANKISKLREELEGKGNWTFTFMGADQNAWANASAYGFSPDNVIAVASAATSANFMTLSSSTRSHRKSTKSGNKASFYR